MKIETIEQPSDFPRIIESTISMSEVNSSIVVYEGEFILRNNSLEFSVNGVINFVWGPRIGPCFSGTTKQDIAHLIFDISTTYQIIVDNSVLGEAYIYKFNIDSISEIKIRGTFIGQCILGDKSIDVNKIVFSVPNLRAFSGDIVKHTSSKGTTMLRNRLNLDNEDYLIKIDKCIDYKNKQEFLDEEGGYIIQYYGELTSKKGPLKFDGIKDIVRSLNCFLSFINGRRTSALFIQGIFDDDVIWCDYSASKVEAYSFCPSWPPSDLFNGIQKLWINFSNIWHEATNKEFLQSIIHWYVESNNQKGAIEGSIIMTQTGLELLYNWWIIEKKKLISGNDCENLNASNKIRLLLSSLDISYAIPKSFDKLHEYKNENKINDAPEAIVQIRNAIVHSQEGKRKRLQSMQTNTLYEALQLSIWYIELVLLKILNYNEVYSNRCSDEQYASLTEEPVPWTKKN